MSSNVYPSRSTDHSAGWAIEAPTASSLAFVVGAVLPVSTAAASAGEMSLPVVDSTDIATAAPPTPLRNCPRVRPPLISADDPSVSGTSPSACMARQASTGPRKRLRLVPRRHPVHARTAFAPLTSKRVGTRGAPSPRALLRHSSTRGSWRLRTSSLPDNRSSIRRANSPQAEHPPSKPNTNLLPEVCLPVISGIRRLHSSSRRSSLSASPREPREPSHPGF